MSSITTHLPPGPPSEPVFRLSVEQYHAMIQAGILSEADSVELLEGILFQKMSKNPPHTYTLKKLAAAISGILPTGWAIRLQDPITLSDGEPEPDAAIVRGEDEDYTDHHPGPGDVALVIEVGDSTLARDRGIKLRSYARAGISTYWIVDLIARRIEVYTDPSKSAYSPPEIYPEGSDVPVFLDGKKIGEISVADILV